MLSNRACCDQGLLRPSTHGVCRLCRCYGGSGSWPQLKWLQGLRISLHVTPWRTVLIFLETP